MTSTVASTDISGVQRFSLSSQPMPSADSPTVDCRFGAFLEECCAELAREVPEFPTHMGLYDVAGEAIPQHYFTAIDSDSRAQRQALLQRLYDGLQLFPRDQLSAANQLNADVVGFFFDYAHERGLVGRKGAGLEANEYLIRPAIGLQSELPLFLTELHPMRHAGDAEDYLHRLCCISQQLQEATESLRSQLSTESGPPGLVIRGVIDEVSRFMATAPEDNTLFETFCTKSNDLPGLDREHREALLNDIASELKHNTYPAYEHLLETLKEVEPGAAESPGIWRLADGEAWYDFQLRAATTTTMTADEIHQLGLEEMHRLESDIITACRNLGIRADTVSDCYAELDNRNEPTRKDSAGNRAAIVKRVEKLIHETEPHLADLFHKLPRGRVTVKAIPKFAEANRSQSYQPPSMDGSRAGFFELNTGQLLAESSFELSILVYHEIYPGHHLQIALAQEMENLPTLRRIMTFDAYIEGWAKYAEVIPTIHGLNDDPYYHIARMRRELISTINLVLDTGIHAKRWDEKKATKFFAQHSGMNDDFCRYIVHRSAAVPAQLCAYKIGMLKVLELRQRMEKALAPHFDVRDFHDTILRSGAVPLTTLERLVDGEIAQHATRPPA